MTRHWHPGNRASTHKCVVQVMPARRSIRAFDLVMHSFCARDLIRDNEPIKAAMRYHGLNPVNYNVSPFMIEDL